jgi:biopolymer transport protein ExbB/TolQ
MSSESTGKSAPLSTPRGAANKGNHPLQSPWLWGPLLTVGFYLAIPHVPVYGDALTQYFFGHWVVYAETGLLFVGLAILIGKVIGLVKDRRALDTIDIDGSSLEKIDSPAERARSLYTASTSVPTGLRGTKLISRIRETCEYVARRGSGAAVEDHLRYLADLAVEELTASYAILKTLAWTVPVLGVFGTLLGLTVALHGMGEPDQASASNMITGLGAALAPVVVGLGISVALVFGKLLVERSESRVLARIEQMGIDQLAPCLSEDGPFGSDSPLASAESEAADKLLEKTEALITVQTGLWQEALEGLRNRWIETVRQQQAQFATALEQGMAASLASHSQQLAEAREDFLKCFRAVGLELSRVTAGLQQMGEEHQSLFHREVTEVWQAMQTKIESSRGEHHEHLARSVALLESAVRGWQDDLAKATAAMTAQLHELRRHGEVLQNVAGGEEELLRLQSTLTHNLQSVRAMEKFEESIHSLNAAVHLLTMRTKAHAA